MDVLGVILARAGSKGLPGKCLRDLLGRAVIEYTFDHALASRCLTGIVLTTDCEPARELARRAGIEVIDRPAELATDTATVDAAARHAVEAWEHHRARTAEIIVLLSGNVPVRAPGVIDRAVDHLIRTGADSVRTVAPVSKHHPDWIHRLEGDRMVQFRPNSIYRRQDLEPLFYHDAAVAAVTRKALFAALNSPHDHQAFLGRDRRAILQRCEDTVDIDEPIDLRLAEAILIEDRVRATPQTCVSSSFAADSAARSRPRAGGVIGDRRIGAGEAVFLIAEAGVNHNGSLDTAMALVDAARRAGADAVKFQFFNAADLVTNSAPTAAYQTRNAGTTSQRAMLTRLQLSRAQLAGLRAHCDEAGIAFLATPFGLPELAFLCELNVAALKIASTDLTNERLLEAAAGTNLPIILSTGASTREEIDGAVRRLDSRGARSRLVLLHCVSCYPTPLHELNLAAIATLGASFGVPTGLSDHTISTETGGWAAAAGACVIEKHFTLDRSQCGPDHAMSLDPAQLAEYIANVRSIERAMGDGQLGMRGVEGDVRRAAGRNVVAAVDIAEGALLEDRLLTLKRAGAGIPGPELSALLGRRALVNIKSDTPLSWDLVR